MVNGKVLGLAWCPPGSSEAKRIVWSYSIVHTAVSERTDRLTDMALPALHKPPTSTYVITTSTAELSQHAGGRGLQPDNEGYRQVLTMEWK